VISTSQGALSASRPSIGAISSIRLLVVCGSNPKNSFLTPPNLSTQAHPPGPGFAETGAVRYRDMVPYLAMLLKSWKLLVRFFCLRGQSAGSNLWSSCFSWVSLLNQTRVLTPGFGGLHRIQKSPQFQKRLKRMGGDAISSSMLWSILQGLFPHRRAVSSSVSHLCRSPGALRGATPQSAISSGLW
jgi:hypothetical protein